jgi:hypothetical protein
MERILRNKKIQKSDFHRLFRTMSLLFVVFFSSNASAQEMWGVANSNYAGQMGIGLNPASIVGAPYKWELHILSFDASVMNNYMYLKRNSRLIRNSFTGETVSEDKTPDRYTKTDKWAYSSMFLKYPAFIWNSKKFSLAFNTSTRLGLSANKVPYHLAKFIKEGFEYDPQQQLFYSGGGTSLVLINWQEFAFTGGMVLRNESDWYVSAAATLKYNYGFNSFFVNINDMVYNSAADSLLIVQNLDMEYGHASANDGETSPGSILKKRGKGWGLNYGMEFVRNRNDNFYNPCSKTTDKPYDYKIGVSIIDLGYIDFNTEARTFSFDNASTNWFGIDTVKFDGIGKTDSTLGKQFYGVFMGARDKREFTLYTPAAISAQFDYPLGNNFYANLSVIQRIPLGKYAIKRANQVALTPRYETKRWEVSLPVSFYEQFKPRVGIGFRYGVFTLGSDMISPLVGLTDSYGVDLYLGISIKNWGNCGGQKRSRKPNTEKCKVPNRS